MTPSPTDHADESMATPPGPANGPWVVNDKRVRWKIRKRKKRFSRKTERWLRRLSLAFVALVVGGCFYVLYDPPTPEDAIRRKYEAQYKLYPDRRAELAAQMRKELEEFHSERYVKESAAEREQVEKKPKAGL
jgi:hypothetical protein